MPPVRGASRIVAARTLQPHQRIRDSPYASQKVAQKVARGVPAVQKSQDQGEKKKIYKKKLERKGNGQAPISLRLGTPGQYLLCPEMHETDAIHRLVV